MWQHSSAQVILALRPEGKYGEYCTQILTGCNCSSNQMQAAKTQVFGYVWHLLLFLNAFFQAQSWQQAEEYVPK